MSFTKKLMAYALTVITAVAVTIGSASACTMLYVGSDNTVTGDTYMSRSEDYSNSYNKIAYVSEHGKHPAGSTYEGCTFTFTFTHDSYAYTAVSDDNLVGVGNEEGECPNCGKTHAHSPMEEGGTNEMGLSVSAMDSVYGNSAVKKADPFKSARNGDTNYMSEGDMNTILLGECASAKEAVDLLCSIYDTYGVCEGSGLQISDKNETWYVENYSGTQYIAIKFSSKTVAFNPNVGIIGLVDLDDTDNVIASKNVIAVAKQAGTYVGDEKANTIDYRASYSNPALGTRVYDGLNYLCGVDTFNKDTTTPDDITVSNVDKDGNIVPVYSNIQLKGKLSTKDIVDFYKISSIGKAGNLEWHIFQITEGGDTATATVEWQGINHGGYSVAIPYYPVLTTDVYEGYKFGGIGGVARASEAPTDGSDYYQSGTRFYIYPSGWENGVYWTNDMLSNYASSAACSDEDRAMVKANLAVMQQKCYDKQAEMEAAIASMSTDEAKAYCTEQSAALAKEAHELALALYNHLKTGECTFDKGAVTVQPTAESDGELTYTCIYCGAAETVVIPANPFTDIDYTEYYSDAVIACYNNGIVNGMTATTFQPMSACTRAQFVTMLYRASGCPEVSADTVNPFADVAEDAWFYDAVLWAVENGITDGVDATHFAPNSEVTRAQVVTFLYRASGCPEVEGDSQFEDVAAGTWYSDAIAWAAAEGITNGVDETHFAPNTVCNRAMIATLFCRDFQLV